MSTTFRFDPALTVEMQAPCRPNIHRVDQCEDDSGYSDEEFAVLEDLSDSDCYAYYMEGKLPEGVTVDLLDEWTISWLLHDRADGPGFESTLCEYLGYRRAELKED